jgi:hypothetical protein
VNISKLPDTQKGIEYGFSSVVDAKPGKYFTVIKNEKLGLTVNPKFKVNNPQINKQSRLKSRNMPIIESAKTSKENSHV